MVFSIVTDMDSLHHSQYSHIFITKGNPIPSSYHPSKSSISPKPEQSLIYFCFYSLSVLVALH